jgi:hypothetical protein
MWDKTLSYVITHKDSSVWGNTWACKHAILQTSIAPQPLRDTPMFSVTFPKRNNLSSKILSYNMKFWISLLIMHLAYEGLSLTRVKRLPGLLYKQTLKLLVHWWPQASLNTGRYLAVVPVHLITCVQLVTNMKKHLEYNVSGILYTIRQTAINILICNI